MKVDVALLAHQQSCKLSTLLLLKYRMHCTGNGVSTCLVSTAAAVDLLPRYWRRRSTNIRFQCVNVLL